MGKEAMNAMSCARMVPGAFDVCSENRRGIRLVDPGGIEGTNRVAPGKPGHFLVLRPVHEAIVSVGGRGFLRARAQPLPPPVSWVKRLSRNRINHVPEALFEGRKLPSSMGEAAPPDNGRARSQKQCQ